MTAEFFAKIKCDHYDETRDPITGQTISVENQCQESTIVDELYAQSASDYDSGYPAEIVYDLPNGWRWADNGLGGHFCPNHAHLHGTYHSHPIQQKR